MNKKEFKNYVKGPKGKNVCYTKDEAEMCKTYDVKHLFKPIPHRAKLLLTCKKCQSGKGNHCLLTDGTHDKVCTRCREQERE